MIAIITLNQDTFSNPTLYGIMEQLNEKQISVTLFCGYQDQKIPSELHLTTYFDAPKGLKLPRHPINILAYLKTFFAVVSHIKKNKIKALIAVDPAGLILANRIKRWAGNINIHYCSFEIYFNAEIKNYRNLLRLKYKEIAVTKKVASIVVQDPVRQRLLSHENKVDSSFKNWHLIPVSPKRFTNSQYKIYRKCDFGLTDTDLIYVHSGSIDEWAGIDSIIEALEAGLPKNTYILLHNKNRFDPTNQLHVKLADLKARGTNLIMHDHSFDSYEEYCSFMKCFDYGIVIYKSLEGIYTGMNIKEIGLASGKFSTYMSVGLPSILYNCSTYYDILSNYPIGAIETENNRLIDHINKKTLANISKEACIRFYEEVLEPTKAIDKFINQF